LNHQIVDQLQIVFLCGARDFHAMDWYQSALNTIESPKPIILTDLIESEGFKRLVSPEDIVCKLFVLDKLLWRTQSHVGNVWRNILKAFCFPLQIFLLRRFDNKYNSTLYYAHSMYYLWLAWASGVNFVGTPQGSDILIKPQKSLIFRILSIAAMRSARLITVDSKKMAKKVRELTGKQAMIVQNGIDLNAINIFREAHKNKKFERVNVTSFRGFAPLYRIEQLIIARNFSKYANKTPIIFIYPFFENEYLKKVIKLFKKRDEKRGRVSRDEMYKLFFLTQMAISIPESDSSPRSVYEAIFCGAPVAVTWHPFIDELPDCMKYRLILVDLENPFWFDEALTKACEIAKNEFFPSEEALKKYDQSKSFDRVHKKAINKI
jgi:hypothetical protein